MTQTNQIDPTSHFVAIHKQKLEFTFVLHPQTFFTDSSTTISVPEFDIITEELTIAPEERIYYMKRSDTVNNRRREETPDNGNGGRKGPSQTTISPEYTRKMYSLVSEKQRF